VGGSEEGRAGSQTAADGWQDRFLLKSFIVLFMFPTAFAVFSVLTFPLGLILNVVLPHALLEWVVPIMTYGFGLAGAIWLCFLIWPKVRKETGGIHDGS
jgi:Na+/citrate or Na+/malate symporter